MVRSDFLATVQPFAALPPERFETVSNAFLARSFGAGERIFGTGERVAGLYLVVTGAVDITDGTLPLSERGPRSTFGGGDAHLAFRTR